MKTKRIIDTFAEQKEILEGIRADFQEFKSNVNRRLFVHNNEIEQLNKRYEQRKEAESILKDVKTSNKKLNEYYKELEKIYD